jgi:hypothetical protein
MIAMKTIGIASRRFIFGRAGSKRLEATAIRRQIRIRAWSAKNVARTVGSRAIATSRIVGVNTMIAPASRIRTMTGIPNSAARARRPATRWPSPGRIASRKAWR